MSIPRNINAFLLLDKPVGISSNRALQRVKKILNAKKAGHTGSLDVLASGLLPICLGEATKFSQYLLNADKFYRVVAKLGERTTTCDAEGEVVETKEAAYVTDESLNVVLEQFRGESKQIPSMYSALKHKGKPLYELARKGIEVEREARTIQIHELNLIERSDDFVTLDVRCSKGTYIRNLVDDIGQALGCGAYVYSLRRLGAGVFDASQMVSLETLESSKNLAQYLLPIDSALTQFSEIKLTKERMQALYYGQIVETTEKAVPLIKLINDFGEFFGLGQIQEDGSLKSVRLLSGCQA